MKVMIGKILLEEDKSYFISEDGKTQEPIILKEYELQRVKKYPDSKAIYKDKGNGNGYLQIINSHEQIEELVYHLNYDERTQKASLTTFSNPSYAPESFREHIEANPYNRVQVALYYCPGDKVFKLRNASFMVNRSNGIDQLSAEDYEKRISREIGSKIMKLQDAGINTDDFRVAYSNVRYARYNQQTFSYLQKELQRTFQRQSEQGDFAYGYVSYSVDKNGGMWAGNNPVTTTGTRGKYPFYLHGNYPNEQEYQEYGFEKIEKALGSYKERKQEAPVEEEETVMSPC